MTTSAIYQRNKVTYTFNNEDISKDHSFMDSLAIFESSEIRDGPIKLPEINSVMYIVKDLNKSYLYDDNNGQKILN